MAAPEEVEESPVALAEAAILLRCLLEEWAHGVASAGVAATGTAAIGTAIGTAAIGVAIGIIVAISMTMMTLIMSPSLVASRSGAGAGGIRTDIPAMATHAVMVIATHTVMAMAIHMVMAMATHADTGPHTGTIIIIITAIITALPVTEMAGTAAIGTAIGVASAGVAATGTAAIGIAVGVASAGLAATGTGVRPKSVY